MTQLIVSIQAERLDQIRADTERAESAGADACELRLDSFQEDPQKLARYLAQQRGRVWIITRRSRSEGGECDESPVQRTEFLSVLLKSSQALVDFEFADWQACEQVRSMLLSAVDDGSSADSRFILSKHKFSPAAPESGLSIQSICDARAQVQDQVKTIAKVAYTPRDIRDSFAALDAMQTQGDRVVAICMGEEGLWTRVLAKKLGAFASYASLDREHPTAPGQVSVGEMVKRYRWHEIDSQTRVFGVIGDPIAHSMSPTLFNHWFSELGINAVYIPLRVAGIKACLEGFLQECTRRPWLDIGGFSVTVPHKVNAFEWLGGSGIDSSAQKTGAVNTLVFQNDQANDHHAPFDRKQSRSRLASVTPRGLKPAAPWCYKMTHGHLVNGHNTDVLAAIDSLLNTMNDRRKSLRGLPVDVLGTGGAARAVLTGLHDCGAQGVVYGRNDEQVAKLAHHFECRGAKWEQRSTRQGEVLINCTSVGMWPRVNESPMPPEALEGCRLVFDLIYNPLESKLLADARLAGIPTINGLDTFVRQAAKQFELWIGRTPDLSTAESLIMDEFVRKQGNNP